MRHEFVHFSQNDPLWSQILLGNSTTINIGQAGCYISSFACLANYYGQNETPLTINQAFKDHGLFANLDLVSNDDDLHKLYPDITYINSVLYPNYPPSPANLKQLQDLLSDKNTTVIIEIDLRNGSSHFTPVIDCDGTNVTIMDVWDGVERDFRSRYGDPATNILKFVIYHGVPPVPLQDQLNKCNSDKDMLYNQYQDALHQISDFKTELASIKEKQGSLVDQNQLKGLQTQAVSDFKTKILDFLGKI